MARNGGRPHDLRILPALVDPIAKPWQQCEQHQGVLRAAGPATGGYHALMSPWEHLPGQSDSCSAQAERFNHGSLLDPRCCLQEIGSHVETKTQGVIAMGGLDKSDGILACDVEPGGPCPARVAALVRVTGEEQEAAAPDRRESKLPEQALLLIHEGAPRHRCVT